MTMHGFWFSSGYVRTRVTEKFDSTSMLVVVTVRFLMTGRLFLARGQSSRTLRGCAVAALSCLAFSESCFAISSGRKLGTSLKMSSTSTCSSTFTVAQFPCLDDNYGYLIHDVETGQTAAIDTPCAETYKQELQNRGWTLTHIFNTHQ
jgi:hypothetical protein